MYCKIATRNVKKSFKDYAIYFITLTLAISIFYSFNSINSQNAMLEVNSIQRSFIDILKSMLSLISVFISFILAGLILYASNFLIKKRKRELGLYSILGMSRRKVSRILVLETLIVGMVSLISGLLLGLLLSQGLSVVAAKLFAVDMVEFTFVISYDAMIKTTVYFAIIFFVVMIFNVAIISRYKIIDLLSSGKKNEEIKIKNPLVYLFAFILCIISLAIAYKMVLQVGLDFHNIYFKVSIVLGILGTLLFFFSLAGFCLYMIKRNKKVYFKGLNIFVVRQISNKITTNFISMSLICLMLFMTISVISTGLSLKEAIESTFTNSTPVDASFRIEYLNNTDIPKYRGKFEEVLDKLKITSDKENIKTRFDDFILPSTVGEVFSNKSINIEQCLKNINKGNKRNNQSNLENHTRILNTNPQILKLSSYNELRKAQNKKKITLNSHEAYVVSNYSEFINSINYYLSNNKTINMFGQEFTVKNKKVDEEEIFTNLTSSRSVTIVLNDEYTKDLHVGSSYINIIYPENKKKEKEKALIKSIESNIDILNEGSSSEAKGKFRISGATKELVRMSNKGMTSIILFIGVYLGIIFLISSMAVLAIQQLSEASDSIERYKSLRRLGANEKRINKTIFMQILIYFLLPISLAFIHSLVAIEVVNDYIVTLNAPDISSASVVTALMFIVVYLFYFLATYMGYKNIVNVGNVGDGS